MVHSLVETLANLSNSLIIGFILLLFLYTTSLIATAIPIRFLDPAWHLSLHDLLIANAPIVIVGACLGGLGLSVLPDKALISSSYIPSASSGTLRALRIRYQMICVFIIWLHAAMIPCQVLAAFQQFEAIGKAQQVAMQSIDRQQDLMASRIRDSRTLGDLKQLLPAGPVASLEKLTVHQLQAEFHLAIAKDRKRLLERSVRDRNRRQSRLVLNSLRVNSCALFVSLFFWLLSRLFYKYPLRKVRDQVNQTSSYVPSGQCD